MKDTEHPNADPTDELDAPAVDDAIREWLPHAQSWEPPAGFAEAVVTQWEAESGSSQGQGESPRRGDAEERKGGSATTQGLVALAAAAIVVVVGWTLLPSTADDDGLEAASMLTSAASSDDPAGTPELSGPVTGADGDEASSDPIAEAPAPDVRRPEADAGRSSVPSVLPGPRQVAKVDLPVFRGRSAPQPRATTLELPGGNVVVRVGSDVKLGPKGGRHPKIEHTRGTATYRFDKPRTVAITTPHGAMTVTGSRFRVMVRRGQSDKAVIVIPLAGTAHIKTASGRKRLKAGDRIAVAFDEPHPKRPRRRKTKRSDKTGISVF